VYPELGNASLWCCTELTTRSAIDTVCGLLSEYEETAKTNEPRMQEWRPVSITKQRAR